MNESIDRTEEALGRVLTFGSRASTAVLAVGLAVALAFPSAGIAGWLLTIGLVLLIMTPVARVGVSVIAFARQREWFFLACTSIVLALLIVGILIAVRE